MLLRLVILTGCTKSCFDFIKKGLEMAIAYEKQIKKLQMAH